MSPTLLASYKKVAQLPVREQQRFARVASDFIASVDVGVELSAKQVSDVKKRLAKKNVRTRGHDVVWSELL